MPTKEDLRKKYYLMLMQFTNGNAARHHRLLRLPGYCEQDIIDACTAGLIIAVSKNADGDIIYKITAYGKQVRDS